MWAAITRAILDMVIKGKLLAIQSLYQSIRDVTSIPDIGAKINPITFKNANAIMERKNTAELLLKTFARNAIITAKVIIGKKVTM